MLCYVCENSQTIAYMKQVDTSTFRLLKALLQMNSGSLVIKQKRLNKQKDINEA